MSLEILYQDDNYVAINKPPGLLVHRSPIDKHETRFAIQILRDQIGIPVHPAHRLDKPTSGVLLFAKDKDSLRLIRDMFDADSAGMESKVIQKKYLAIVRGHIDSHIDLDYPVKERSEGADHKKSQPKPARTLLTRLDTSELDISIETYPTSRFSLVELSPITGRRHQLRYHTKHLGHPIIGDPKYGRGKYNRFFAEHFSCPRLLLSAAELSFDHPVTGEKILIKADPGKQFRQCAHQISLSIPNQYGVSKACEF